MKNKSVVLSLIIVFFVALGLGIILGNCFPQVTPAEKGEFDTFIGLDVPLKYRSLFQRVYSDIKTHYIVPSVDESDLYYGALEGMVRGLDDPYSVFLKPDLAKKFREDMRGSFEGVGMEIGIKNKQLTVIAPLPDTPAEKAGLRAGDEIYAVDGEPTSGMPIDMAVSLIRGEKGTPVTLTIWRDSWGEFRDIEIIRDTIQIKTVSFKQQTPQIAYFKIAHFSEGTLNEFKEAVQKIDKSNLRGIILDLRSNPGGYLETAVEIAGWWVEKGKKRIVVSSRNNIHQERVYKTEGKGDFANLKTVVLIDNGSASGSEILAGALQDWEKATLIGETTFGKGSVQILNPLPDGSALKLTVAYWYTPKGRSIRKEGINPDIEVPFTEEDYKKGRDPQLEKAIEILEKSI